MKYTRVSTYLIYLTVFLLLINVVMILFIFHTVKVLEDDASVINHMGLVRGSIQRVAKLEVSGIRSLYSNLIEDTDSLIENLLKNKKIIYFAEGYASFDIENIQLIQLEWQNLKILLTEYSKHPTNDLLIKIVNKSEQCWYLTDFAVLNAQTVAENKVLGINFFYFILSIYTVNIFIVMWVVYTFVRRNLEFRASYDSLTRLLNRHSYERSIESEIDRSSRYETTFALIIYDVDLFKKINDTHGHETGDKILIELSNLVKKSIRKSDEVFRVGGEEFAIIVPETDADGALILAEKIRKEVEEHQFYKNLKVTVSLGVSDSNSGKTISDIYRQADDALYKAKNSGRNKVEKYLS